MFSYDRLTKLENRIETLSRSRGVGPYVARAVLVHIRNLKPPGKSVGVLTGESKVRRVKLRPTDVRRKEQLITTWGCWERIDLVRSSIGDYAVMMKLKCVPSGAGAFDMREESSWLVGACG